MSLVRIADIIAMTALVIVVLISLIIAANLQNVSANIGASFGNTTEGATYNATSATLFTNVWTGLTLASVGIIISAAVGILALVLSSLGRASGGVT